MPTTISSPLLNRLTRYLNYLTNLPEHQPATTSSTMIGGALDLNDVQVRKDLAIISNKGKPKIGYVTSDLISDIEHFLGHDNISEAVLVGAGNLGRALLSYGNFEKYGLDIVAAFDSSPALIDRHINGRAILDAGRITDLCKRMNIKIGIITVPDIYAQKICDALVDGGVRGIWNFAPVNIRAPENVVIKNEDMAASLAILTKQLAESLANDEIDQLEEATMENKFKK